MRASGAGESLSIFQKIRRKIFYAKCIGLLFGQFFVFIDDLNLFPRICIGNIWICIGTCIEFPMQILFSVLATSPSFPMQFLLEFALQPVAKCVTKKSFKERLAVSNFFLCVATRSRKATSGAAKMQGQRPRSERQRAEASTCSLFIFKFFISFFDKKCTCESLITHAFTLSHVG